MDKLTDDIVPDVLTRLRKRLAVLEKEEDVPLAIEEHDYKVEDEWLYICVTPSRPGVRASDYATTMVRIERELREEGYENVLLVPTLQDYRGRRALAPWGLKYCGRAAASGSA